MSAELSEEFEAWAAGVGYEVFREWESTIVATRSGGEIRYTVSRTGDTFTVLRAERAEDDIPLMRTTRAIDVERYLTAQLGIAVRSRGELPRLSFPFQPEDAAPGFRVQDIAPGWATLVRTDGNPIDATFADTSMHPAVRFSYFADADPAGIRRSFADPPGSPLFAQTLETSRGIKGFLDREAFG